MTVHRLEVAGVSHSFSPGNRETLVLSDVSVRIAAGEFVSLVGPSGCGKSTLLSMLAGLVRPSSGQILNDGVPLLKPTPESVGMVFQEANLLPWLSAAENVAFPLRIRGVPKAERLARARDMLAVTGLQGYEDALPKELSGGMKQRVSIARGLVQDPMALLLDEPFAALDEQTRLLLGDQLLTIWKSTGKTIVFVTHSLTEAVYLSTRVIVLSGRPGRVVDDISVDLSHPRHFEQTSSSQFSVIKERIWRHIRDAETAHA